MLYRSALTAGEGMTEKAAYEAVGIRRGGSTFAMEILGYQTVEEAADLARHYAGLWEKRSRPVSGAVSQAPR